jgi:radical SAM-linked protein
MAFTRGFNPHPKISFAAPLGVGTAGEGEFADLELGKDIPAETVAGSLSKAMPEGLRVLEARLVPDRHPALMSMVDRATYRATAKLGRPVSGEELAGAIAAFLSLPEIAVERKSKAGEKKKHDIRPGIFAMSGKLDGDIIILETELKTGSSGNVRLEELLSAFESFSRLPVQGRFTLSRTGLYAAGEKNKRTLW